MRSPAGYMNCREMFDIIGRELFGPDWTGELEYRARTGLWTISEYELAKITTSTVHSGSGSGPGRNILIRTPEDPSSADYQAERVARVRYEAALQEFLIRLEVGRATAAALNTDTGKIHPINREVWRTTRALGYLKSEKGPAGSYYRNRTLYYNEGPLLIELPKTLPAKVGATTSGNPGQPGRRGPKVSMLDQVKVAMRKIGVDEVDTWKEEAMAKEFGASRDTCRKARAALRAELVGK